MTIGCGMGARKLEYISRKDSAIVKPFFYNRHSALIRIRELRQHYVLVDI